MHFLGLCFGSLSIENCREVGLIIFYKNFLTAAIFFPFFFFLNLLPIMEKLLVAENKSYEAYRTNSNKQALSETPANGLRFARFFNASIVSVK